MALDTFMQLADGSTPRDGAFDPRIVYDVRSQRWIACALERQGANGDTLNNEMILAVSTSSDPVGTTIPGNVLPGWQTNRWAKYRVNVHQTGRYTDFPILSVDAHGVYVGLNYLNSPTGYVLTSDIAALAKPLLISNQPFSVQKPNSASPLIYRDYGRIFDTDTTTLTPWFYFMSSLTVNSRQDVVMSFSGSSAGSGNYLSAFFSGRYAGSPAGVMCSPRMIHQGYGYLSDHNPARVGDISTTSLDPNDQLSFWTNDEICDGSGFPDPWGSWAAAIQVQ
jgi:hypothetical protein